MVQIPPHIALASRDASDGRRDAGLHRSVVQLWLSGIGRDRF